MFPRRQENPPPGSYDVDQSYRKSHGKRDGASPRSESAKKRNYAFQTSSSRFVPPRDVKLEETDPANPGASDCYGTSVESKRYYSYTSRTELPTGTQSSFDVAFGCNHARTDAGVMPGVYAVLRQVSSNDVRLLFFIVRVVGLYFLVITCCMVQCVCWS